MVLMRIAMANRSTIRANWCSVRRQWPRFRVATADALTAEPQADMIIAGRTVSGATATGSMRRNAVM